MNSIARLIAVPMLIVMLGGCQRNGCDEFAPPPDRPANQCPGNPAKTAAKPAAMHPRYCYRTLGQPDCYDAPQPQLAASYIGTYPN
jgi:hypothetical protein